uniref:Glucosylceramidase n=1 Tax=Acrobeloides nanus TaxID=290746 RepID=A0A914DNG8_9BILA
MVCVCNSTYCDEFPPLGQLQPGQAAIYTSSQSGKRFDRTDAFFNADGRTGYTVGRVPMAGCDFSAREYSYDDVDGDFDLTNFGLTIEDLNYKRFCEAKSGSYFERKSFDPESQTHDSGYKS